MTVIEMPNGAKATLHHDEWTSPTLGLANVLQNLMVDCEPSPAEGNAEWYRAHHVATKVSARILDHTASYEYVPRRRH